MADQPSGRRSNLLPRQVTESHLGKHHWHVIIANEFARECLYGNVQRVALGNRIAFEKQYRSDHQR